VRPVPQLTSAVQGSGLVLTYDGRVAMEASDFEVPTGRVTAVIGPNGSGKSTLLNAMAGLHEPAAGRLEVLGKPPGQVRRWVAYVLQASRVNRQMPITVREVVAMGRYAGRGFLGRLSEADRQAVDDALERLEIGPLAARRLHELSAGQRQRVFVAQGLAQDRRLFLLDEPVTGLDLVSRDHILAAVDEERQAGRTVVMTTHELSEAGFADQVLLLAGRVVAAGAPEEVLTAPHLSEAYGVRMVEIGGRLVVDDPAHAPVGQRHLHRERRGER
jgi:iron complex transport system ATP-binding protein